MNPPNYYSSSSRFLDDTISNKQSDIERETDDLIQLFSKTIRSLAADACTIRQITDMADLLLVREQRTNESEDSDNSSNNNSMSIPSKLIQLDKLVATAEHKVVVLRQILAQEKSALTKFETNLKQEANDQKEFIQALNQLVQQFREKKNNNDDEEASTIVSNTSSSRASSFSSSHRRSESSMSTLSESTRIRGRRSSISSTTSSLVLRPRSSNGILSQPPERSLEHRSSSLQTKKKRHLVSFRDENEIRYTTTTSTTIPNNDDQTSTYSCFSESNECMSPQQSTDNTHGKHRFVPVTEDELQQHTRFGPHMCRYDINEALDEIQSVVWKHPDLGVAASQIRTLQLNRSWSFDDDDYNNSSMIQDQFPTVTEQELRENCAFFRHGESTARSTLQLLCSLKRLKQLPGRTHQTNPAHRTPARGRNSKNKILGSGDVTYVCLFGNGTKAMK